ncbi:MAG: acyl-CoA/acyl-ACP dehydrogenase [Chloroflexi bacterium]|nr:acyl-CoA/acyl-ACP dehydrogenase [Chloroflexota bacterium]
MDMEFTEEQRQLMNTARSFLEKECPSALVRELETSDLGFSPGLWRKMANLGWLGLPFPDEYGGYDLGVIDLVVLGKELGRVLCPSPYIPTVVLAGGAIAAAGSEEQKKTHLPRIISGEELIAFALQESGGSYSGRGIKTTATETDGGYVLSGTKMFVEFAEAADRLLVVAHTSGDADSTDGLTMFLLDAKSAGVKLTPLSTLARDRQYRVDLTDVKVPGDDILGPVDGAWPLLEKTVHTGVVTLCAYMVGASETIHHMANEFAKERIQFGRPIGSFQAIQHYLAQTITEIIGADTLTIYAAWALDNDLPHRTIVAKAKSFTGDTFKQASSIGAQIHGGLGYNEEVDTTLFLRRGKQYQLSMGDSGHWEDVIAEELLDN